MLGKGAFGIVRRGVWGERTPVAVKELIIDMAVLEKISQDTKDEFEKEALLHATLRHPNVVQLYGLCKDGPVPMMVLELMKTSLAGVLLDSRVVLLWPERLQLALEIVDGLGYLHTNGIIHRDLKSMNVLISKSNEAKLTDFGLAKVKSATTSTTGGKGTPAWMAPELFDPDTAHYTKASDMYALGMTIWEVCARKLPFSDAPNAVLLSIWVAKGKREPIPADTPPSLKAIIGSATSGCWAGDPSVRPTLAQVAAALDQALVEVGGMNGGASGGGAAAAVASAQSLLLGNLQTGMAHLQLSGAKPFSGGAGGPPTLQGNLHSQRRS